MASALGVDPHADAAAFVRYFSGDVGHFSEAQRPWSTPYAVSVFGQAIPSPDPFGRGNAYGDGRAVSLGDPARSQPALKLARVFRQQFRVVVASCGGTRVIASPIAESSTHRAPQFITTRSAC